MKYIKVITFAAALGLAACTSTPAAAEQHVETVAVDEAHPLNFLFGTWEGPASGMRPDGPFDVTQTERVGPMLGGDIVVLEGRGYEEDGSLGFNAFAVISKNTYSETGWDIRSYADGFGWTFPFEPRENGFTWSIPAGPNARMVFEAVIEDGVWNQTGTYTPEDGEPRQTFQMTLTRTGDTNWPAAGAPLPAGE